MGAYVIKWGQETAWAVFIAVLGVVYTFVSELTIDELLADPVAIIALIGVAIGRVVGAVLLNAIGGLVGGSGE